jgi:co-chaperonin GroES (HSP10)
MNRLTALVAALVMVSAVLSAHGDYVHIRGVVTKLAASSMSVETSEKTAKTVTLGDKTTFEKSGKPATLADLKVGDKVIVEVHKGTLQAGIVRFGPAAAPHKVK